MTDAVSGEPVQGILVNAWREISPGVWENRYASTTTGTDGRYTIGLPEGEWRLEFWDPMAQYAAEFSGDVWFADEGTSLAVSPGETVFTGALLANQNGMASPNQLYWTQSGMLLVMVILGGVGRRYGGVLGAFALLGLEEALGLMTEYAHLVIGLALLGVVLFAPHGLAGLAGQWRRRA